ncbi:hypothetical protein EAG_10859 [Camponotus floridanus]|uniref:Uncharacterized protein n=1 Tax=Camponotus floridanus TaxID=104421 RepID=E2A9K7_CAMFO|nr:hypothetical protein EAG_10859 [Camponotus floridanus]
MGSGEERRERMALSELRIIITVVVGAARKRRGGARGYTMMDQAERRMNEASASRGMEKGVFTHRQYTSVRADTEDGPRWKSTVFGGTGQENCLTTFRTGSELPNRSPAVPSVPHHPFLDGATTTYAQICGPVRCVHMDDVSCEHPHRVSFEQFKHYAMQIFVKKLQDYNRSKPANPHRVENVRGILSQDFVSGITIL